MRHILIVEDSPTMRALLMTAREELGPDLKLVEAESGVAALRELPRRRYDLVITDVNMPDLNGLDLLSFVRGSPGYRNVPLLVVSSEGQQRDVAKAVGLGADAYLVKPVDPETLCGAVRDLLDQPRRGG